MSFGAFVLLQKSDSDEFEYLSVEHECAITEIRVEQHLDKQTSFAIRFQEDFEDDAAVEATQRLFAKSKGVAICVADGPPPITRLLPAKFRCLVRGQVENVEFNVSVGGSGSWFEIRGQDVRTQINRTAEAAADDDYSDKVIAKLVQPCVSEEPEVAPAIKHYLGEKTSFIYLGSPLEAVYDLASKSNYSFWLEYEVEPRFEPIPLLAEPIYVVKSTAYIQPSPPRPEDAPPELSSFEGLDLVAEKTDATLMILGNEQQCETVVSFNSYVDNEVISSTKSYAQNLDDGGEQENEGEAQDAPLNPGESPKTVGGQAGAALEADEAPPRYVQVARVADPELARWQAYAAATAASWYHRAEALTTVHMLGHVLQPHQIVKVEGGGCGIAGKYQVSDVTHVINPAAHWMQVKLRSNSRTLERRPNGA